MWASGRKFVSLGGGNLRRALMGDDSPDRDTLSKEGELDHTHILLGYEVNVDALSARLPDGKVCGSWGITHGPVFKPGNRIIPAENAQVVRGLINHWMGAIRFWKYNDAPFNAILGFSD